MFLDNHIVVARWSKGGKYSQNWGDLLNSELIHLLSASPVAHVDDVLGWDDRPVYNVIGSALGITGPNDIVWGMGFLDSTTMPKQPPKNILAVRGLLSRNRLIDAGISCPQIYGDPAVLYPAFYYPEIEKKYDIGIIQHFREGETLEKPQINGADRVLHIDICSGIKNVVDQILSCEKILSSSLHGIICSHAYGVPAHWMKLSDMPLGDDFKFYDYYSSIGFDDVFPGFIGQDNQFFADRNPDSPAVKRINPELLIESCPFMSNAQKQYVTQMINDKSSQGKKGIIF